jgi:RNA polymerase sigma-B factor
MSESFGRGDLDRAHSPALLDRLGTLDRADPAWQETRDQLVTLHLPLAEHLARRFTGRGEPYEDLLQVASIGLIKSIDRYDPSRGVEFSTFATPTILGEIKRWFRDKGWAIRVPRRLQELRMSVSATSAELTQALGRSPTMAELAEAIGVNEDTIIEALESASAYTTLSLDAPDSDDGEHRPLDNLGAEDAAIVGVENREALVGMLSTLPERERRIVVLRFFRGMTQSQIADEVGISQMHVSRLLSRSLQRLREALVSDTAV